MAIRTNSKRSGQRGRASNGPPEATAPDETPRAPRQDRGQKRVEEILDAAEGVIAEVGWDAATTQAIAERAGASVGSLFHFFPSRDAILIALGERYTRATVEVNARAMPIEAVHSSAEELFEGIIRAHAEYSERVPGLAATYQALERKFGFGTGPLCSLDDALHESVRHFCTLRLPRMPEAVREPSARLMILVVHQALHLGSQMPPKARQQLLTVARDMLAAYQRDLDARYGGPAPVAAVSGVKGGRTSRRKAGTAVLPRSTSKNPR